MLQGWLREKALSARRRLLATLAIVGMQTLFDAAVPQVSMTAHLSGVLIGFAVSLMLRDNLKSALPLPAASESSAAGTTRSG
jgi:membrane associated rhomboid family serine protease